MLSEIVAQFEQQRVLIIGDLIADEFVYGEITRVSREAPVMILRHERTETMPGGAGNAAANVAALARRAAIIGVIGRDRAGRQLTLELRARGVNTEGIVKLAGYHTPTKTRILAGSVHSTRQQVIRIDREPPQPGQLTEQLLARLDNPLTQADAVIISDYNYGVVSSELLIGLRRRLQDRQIPVIVDSRFCLSDCQGFTAATPNHAELAALANSRLDSEVELLTAGEEWRRRLGFQVLLVTRGSEGMVLFEADKTPFLLTAVGSKEPVDVTGAGDTVIAAFTLALASGASYQQAAQIANHAGGIVVMKRGTAIVTPAELQNSLTTYN